MIYLLLLIGIGGGWEMELTDTPTFLLLAGLVFTLIIYEGFRLKAKEQKK